MPRAGSTGIRTRDQLNGLGAARRIHVPECRGRWVEEPFALEPFRYGVGPPVEYTRSGAGRGAQVFEHSFRVGGAVSQTLAGTAIDALMDVAVRGPHPSASGTLKPSEDRPEASLEIETRYEAAMGLVTRGIQEEAFK